MSPVVEVIKMEYSRFDDVVLLLIELCKPFSDTEIENLMDVKIAMAKDKDFELGYTTAVKGLYVKNFKKLQDKTYKKQGFAEINQQLTSKAKEKIKEAVLLPPYTKTGNEPSDPSREKLRAKILRMYDKHNRV